MTAGLFYVSKDLVTLLKSGYRNGFAVRRNETNSLGVLHNKTDRKATGVGFNEHHRPFFDFVSAEIGGLSCALEIDNQDFVAGLEIGKIFRLIAGSKSVSVNGAGVDPEGSRCDIRIVNGFGMHEKECRGGVSDKDALAEIHLSAGVETGTVTHTELLDGGYSSGDKRDFFRDALNEFGGLFYFIYIGGIEEDAIDSFFEDFGHKFCLFGIINLHHNIFSATGQQIFNGDNGPVEHTQDDDFIGRDFGGLVFVGFAFDINEFDIFAGDDVALFFNGFYFAEFTNGLGFTIGQDDSLCAAFEGGDDEFFFVGDSIYPEFFHKIELHNPT